MGKSGHSWFIFVSCLVVIADYDKIKIGMRNKHEDQGNHRC